jgi:hypothetical protein
MPRGRHTGGRCRPTYSFARSRSTNSGVDLPLATESAGGGEPLRSGAGSQQTPRWREMDSNPRSPMRGTTLFETAFVRPLRQFSFRDRDRLLRDRDRGLRQRVFRPVARLFGFSGMCPVRGDTGTFGRADLSDLTGTDGATIYSVPNRYEFVPLSRNRVTRKR